jgi:quinol monooxygenase YgiN
MAAASMTLSGILAEHGRKKRASGGRMKFVIGWLKLKPGRRDEFMAVSRPFIAATLREEGVVFFEFHHNSTDLDGVVVVECYKSHAAHELHWATPHFATMWKEVERLTIEGRFENIFADRTASDVARFDVAGR